VEWTLADPAHPRVAITPGPLTGGGSIDCGLAGTVMRFIPPLAALAGAPVRFDGDPAARRRPMAPLIDALRALGAEVDDGGRGALPFTVTGRGGLAGGRVAIDASASSQFLSALLLAGPRCERGVEAVAAGHLPSEPHARMTLAALRAFGAQASAEPPGWRSGGHLTGRARAVEPDVSNAAPFLAAALAAGGRVRVPGWPAATTQAGDRLRDYLRAFGGRVEWWEGTLTVTGDGRPCGADLDLAEAGELTPVLAALATLADSPSRLTGIGHLRGHETDRLAALATEIRRFGGSAEELEDGLAITPGALHGATAKTYGDHRMAAFAAVIGAAVPGVKIEDIATTAKTYPGFAAAWAAFLGETE
jgi:3-phosphoshikimate 1-carboxyvinyltransferase